MPQRRLISAVLIALTFVLAIPSVGDSSTGNRLRDRQAGSASAQGLAFALLADNRLFAVSLPDGKVVAQRRLGPPPPLEVRGEWWRSADGHYLALSKNGHTVYAVVPGLVPGRLGGTDHLAIIDAATVRVRAAYPLIRGLAFHSVAVGRRTGRLYLFGNRAVGGGFASSPADAVVIVMDAKTGTVLANWTAKKAQGYNHFSYRGLVSSNERKLFISYHGFDTTGVDAFTISRRGLQRCQSPCCQLPYGPRDGCILGHGSMELYGDGLLVSEGNGSIYEIGAAGRVRRTFDSGLKHNHLLEFTIDRQAGRLYAVGSCSYAGGFTALDLRSGRSRILVQEPNYDICGERSALASSSLLVIAKTLGVIPQIGLQGHLLFLDTRTGQVQRRILTPAEAVDVLVSPGS